MIKKFLSQINSCFKDRNSFYMFGLGIQEIIFMFFIGFLIPVATIVLIIWALVDILKSEFTGSNKVIWVLVVLFLPLIGSILYLVIGRKQKIVKEKIITEEEK